MDAKGLDYLNRATLLLQDLSDKFSQLIGKDLANRWTDEGRALADKIIRICRFQKKLYGTEKARFDAHLRCIDELERDLSQTRLSDGWKDAILLHLKIVLQHAQQELEASGHPPQPREAFPPFSSISLDAGSYARLVGLPQRTVDALVLGEIRFFGMAETARINKQLAIDRFKELDAYGSEEEGEEQQDEEVILEGPQDLNYLFDPLEKGRLNADGLFLTIHHLHRGHGRGLSLELQGSNSGYALLHPVAPMYNRRCTPFYKEARKRANWEGIRAYLSTVLSREIRLDQLYHHFDYAIIPPVGERVTIKDEARREQEKERDRKKVLGRLVLRASFDKVLPPEAIAIGFIDPDPSHCDSLIAAARAGCLIGREVDPAFDGPHPAFLELFCKTWQWDFTNIPVLSQRTGQPYDHHKEGKEGLPDALRAAFRSYPKSLVGFCRERNRFEIATARHPAPMPHVDAHFETVVIGGGPAGLHATHALLPFVKGDPSKDKGSILLIEAGKAIEGTQQMMNGSIAPYGLKFSRVMSTTLFSDSQEALKSIGGNRALGSYLHFMRRNFATLRRMADSFGQDIIRQNGFALVFPTDKRHKEFMALYDSLLGRGYCQEASSGQVNQWLGSTGIGRGIFMPEQYCLDAQSYLFGLFNSIHPHVTLLEQAKVDSLIERDGKVLIAAGGTTILADKVVLATNGFFQDPFLRKNTSLWWTFEFTYDYRNLSSSSSPNVAVFHPGTAETNHYYMTLQDGHFLIGGEDVEVHDGNTRFPPQEHLANATQRIDAWVKSHIPTLRASGMNSHHYGVLTCTPDGLPIIGARKGSNVYYFLGCNGIGYRVYPYGADLLSGVMGYKRVDRDEHAMAEILSPNRKTLQQ